MAELRVPDSQSERRDKKALKAYALYLKSIEEGKSPWLTKKALAKRFDVCVGTMNNWVHRAEKLTADNEE